MHCKQARDLLLLACEHELPEDDGMALTAHLDTCPECDRFAVAMRHWVGAPGHNPEHLGFMAGSVVPQRGATPDLTARVLASVRPLPPPWAYHETQWEKRRPHVIGFAIGALAVTCAFVVVSLALIVAFASGNVTGATSHAAVEAMVGDDVRQWFDTLPRDLKHAAITLGAFAVFASLVLRWFHALALRLGDDHHSLWKS